MIIRRKKTGAKQQQQQALRNNNNNNRLYATFTFTFTPNLANPERNGENVINVYGCRQCCLVVLNCWTLLQFWWTENWTELNWTINWFINNFSSRKSNFFETSSTFFLWPKFKLTSSLFHNTYSIGVAGNSAVQFLLPSTFLHSVIRKYKVPRN